MVTCSRAGHTHPTFKKSINSRRHHLSSRIVWTYFNKIVAGTSFTKADMNRHCAAINETSNKKKRTGRELLNLETIRRAGQQCLESGEAVPLSVMIYYIIFICSILQQKNPAIFHHCSHRR